MQPAPEPTPQTTPLSAPSLHVGQQLVIWPDPVSIGDEPSPLLATVREVDEETGRMVVEPVGSVGWTASQPGTRVVVIAAAAGEGLYYRHCDLQMQEQAILLAAADEWRRLERRQATRVSVAIPTGSVLRYATSGGFWRMEGIIRNISTSGLLLEAKQRVDVDDRLEMVISLFDGRPGLRVRARVVRVITSPVASAAWFAGCRFEGLHPNDQERLSGALPRLPAGEPFLR